MADEPMPFEDSLAELGQIVQLLERGQPSLAESLAKFERGIELLRICKSQLDHAETRIRELVEIDEQGHAKLRDFDHQASHQNDSGASSVKKPRRKAPTHKVEPADPDGTLF